VPFKGTFWKLVPLQQFGTWHPILVLDRCWRPPEYLLNQNLHPHPQCQQFYALAGHLHYHFLHTNINKPKIKRREIQIHQPSYISKMQHKNPWAMHSLGEYNIFIQNMNSEADEKKQLWECIAWYQIISQGETMNQQLIIIYWTSRGIYNERISYPPQGNIKSQWRTGCPIEIANDTHVQEPKAKQNEREKISVITKFWENLTIKIPIIPF